MARKVGLDLDQILAVATVIADGEGLGGLTLARVAEELGVRSPSLYSHVDGLAGLHRAMAFDAAARLGADIADVIRDRSGAEALKAIGHAYRSFALGHPGLYATMLPTPAPDDDEELYLAFAAPVGVIAEVLADLGVAEEDTVSMVRAYRSALHGFVSLEVNGGFGLPQDVDESFEALVAVLVAGISSVA
jgi:AcrR family transcriptional regulator